MESTRIFKTESVFRRKLNAYIKACSDEKGKRLPNAAGFCRFCSIKRSDYAEMKAVYPLMYDIAESTFIDEALNTKIVNSGASMSFMHDFTASLTQSGSPGEFRFICEHDAFGDGE
jgi:hypothetical protein